MEINYYRIPTTAGTDESWQNCQFTSETDLSAFTVNPLVSINGQPILRQHHVTYLTGKETCHAHHFAKHLAIQLLSAPSDKPDGSCKVLWIDTLHGPHVCASIYRELAAHATSGSDLHFVCLDILGSQRDNVYAINRYTEALIKRLEPDLVVVDDIDHFMPFCGVTVATDFCRIVRDITNHSETAFLFIGYNHLGKKASTTGNLGKFLFLNATDVFSLSTQRDVTTVRLVNSYNMSCRPIDSLFNFTIGTDNLPHEVGAIPKRTRIDDQTLSGIINDVLEPGQPITPDDLLQQVTQRHRQLNHQQRTDDLITQALTLNLIHSVEIEGATHYTLNPSNLPLSINNPLTLPPHPSARSTVQ